MTRRTRRTLPEYPIALRLTGARLAAGHVARNDGADAMGINRKRYGLVESAIDPLHADVASGAVRAYGVSAAFLRQGIAKSPRERMAARIAAIQAAVDQHSDRGARLGSGDRVKAMRETAHGGTARAAATGNQWNLPTYQGHENGGYPAPVDVLIGYALAYGCRPEYAVLGEFPILPTDDEKHPVTGKPSVIAEAETRRWWDSHPWTGTTGMPVLVAEKNRFRLLDQPFSLPLDLLGLRKGPTGLYAYVSPGRSPEIFLVDPRVESSNVLIVWGDGTPSVRPRKQFDADPSDPMSVDRIPIPFLLGSLIARIAVDIVPGGRIKELAS